MIVGVGVTRNVVILGSCGDGDERLCMAMQNVTSNYDTDVFTPLISKVEEITGLKYTSNEVKNISEEHIS